MVASASQKWLGHVQHQDRVEPSQVLPVTKRICTNYPFRCDGAGIELRLGRCDGIISDFLSEAIISVEINLNHFAVVQHPVSCQLKHFEFLTSNWGGESD